MTRASSLLALATFLYALFVFGGYFGFPYQAGLVSLLQLALVLLLSTGAGRVMLRWLDVTDISESQRTLVGATLGLGALSLTAFALCAAHALYLWAALIALGALWVAGATELRDVLVSLGANRNLLGERPMAAAAVAGLLAACLWCTFVPPHQYDALVYHLPLPAAYIRSHGFVAVPTLVYTHFPQNGEMLFTLALLMKSDLLAQMFMWLAGALSVWWVFELGRREAPLSAVMLACVLLASNTAFLLLSCIAYVEALVMLWMTAALFSFLRWRQLDAAGPGDRSWLTLSAIFLGLSLGTKYYAGIAAGLLGVWMALRWALAPGPERGRRAKDLAVLVGISTLLFLPWLAKNAVMAGNPVFPFFNHLFPGGPSAGWNADVAKGYFGALTEYRGLGGWRGLWRLFVLLLTNDARFGGGMDVLGTLGWDLTFWCMPIAAWAAWRNRFFRGLLLFCLAYFCAWAATGVVLRFLLVLAPALSLLAANGLYSLRQRLEGGARTLLDGGVGILLVTHFLLFLFVMLGVYGSGDVLLGFKDREAYLSAKLDYYPCARYETEHGKDSDRILIVGEQRSYYLDRSHVATSLHAPNRFLTWADEAATPAALAGKLSSEGFNKVLLVPRELQRLGSSVGTVTDKGVANWKGLEPDFLKPELKAPNCTLFTLEAPR